MWPSDCGVDHQRHVKAAAHLGDGRGRLDHAAVTGQRREVHQGRRVGGQHSGRLVDDQPAVAVGRQRAHVEAVRGHYRQVGAVLAGQAGHGAAARPAAEQQVQGVGGPGGEDDVGAVRPDQRGNHGTSRVEHRCCGLGGHISADLGSCRACWAAASMTAKLCREQAALSTCSPAAFGRADVDRAHRCPAAKSSTLRASTTRTPSSRALRICAGANAGILRCWSRWNSRSRTSSTVVQAASSLVVLGWPR